MLTTGLVLMPLYVELAYCMDLQIKDIIIGPAVYSSPFIEERLSFFGGLKCTSWTCANCTIATFIEWRTSFYRVHETSVSGVYMRVIIIGGGGGGERLNW